MRELVPAPEVAPRAERALAGVVREQLGDPRDPQPLVGRFALDQQLTQVGLHPRCERVHQILPATGDLGEPAHRPPQHEAARAKVVPGIELQADRLERRRHPAVRSGRHQHPRRPGPQRRSSSQRSPGTDHSVDFATGEIAHRASVITRTGSISALPWLATNTRPRTSGPGGSPSRSMSRK